MWDPSTFQGFRREDEQAIGCITNDFTYQYQSLLRSLVSRKVTVHTLTILLVAPKNVQMEVALQCVVEIVGMGDFCKPRSGMLC